MGTGRGTSIRSPHSALQVRALGAVYQWGFQFADQKLKVSLGETLTIKFLKCFQSEFQKKIQEEPSTFSLTHRKHLKP